MDIERVFQKLRPVYGKRLDDLWRTFLLVDAKTRSLMEASLRAELADLGASFDDAEILLVPPPAERAAGDIPLGTVHYAGKPVCPFGVRVQELASHTFIGGRTGTGKTTICFSLLKGLAERGIPWLALDWKRNYRDLLGLPGFDKLDIYTVGRSVAPFSFNPLQPPPGTEALVHLKRLADILGHAYFLGEGVAYLLQEALNAVYTEAGVYEGSGRWPTMADVRDWLLAYPAKGRQAAWMDSALRAVGVLCFGEMGRVLNARAPLDPAALLDRNVVLELDALSNSDKTFLTEALLSWIHAYRLAQPGRERLKHVLVIEEAHHILNRKQQESSGKELITDILMREIRELGEGVVILDQKPGLISRTGLSEPLATIALNLKHRSDLTMLADSLLLEREEAKVLGRLEVGWGLVKLQGRWHRPFLVRFPAFPLEKGRVTDDMLRRTEQPASSIFLTSSSPPGNPSPAHLSGRKDRLLPAAGRVPSALEEGVEQMLADIHQHPLSTIPVRLLRCHLSTGSGVRLLSSMERSGLISSSYIRTPRGRVRWLELTPSGAAAIGLPSPTRPREGGPEHRYWVARASAWLASQGFAVTPDAPVPGGFVDLVGTKPGERVALEVETGKSDAVANVHRLRGEGFTRVMVLGVRSGICEEILAKVGSEVAVLRPQDLTVSEGPAG